MLLICIDQKGREIYETFTFALADDVMKLEPLFNKFSEYPGENVTFVCNTFFTYRQLEGQNFHDFNIELEKLTAECEFENLRDSLIKNAIVCGTNGNVFRERLLRESDHTFPRAISAQHAAKETRKHAREILQSQSTYDLHKFNTLRKSFYQATNDNSKEVIKKCKFFNGSYHRGKCPAYGKFCLNCNRKKHFKVCCPKIEKRNTKSSKSRVAARSLPSLNFL